MASTRLPGKPLADINGKPMIVHVLECGWEADLGPVAVACGEMAIADVVRAAGGRAVLTNPDLPSGSDRVFAALAELDPDARHDVVVNLQGDMPTNTASFVKAACVFAAGQSVAPALYFSRQPIPWGGGPRWHHVGIYAYRRAALERYVALPPSPLEIRE